MTAPRPVLQTHVRVAVYAGYLGYYAQTFDVAEIGGALAGGLIVMVIIDIWRAVADDRTTKDASPD